ncbi:MAG TPA: hypothetical protein VN231_12525 [Allosphingosinicella sp.]|nr:hypothetical protein [Allosphingosinicella sp.]
MRLAAAVGSLLLIFLVLRYSAVNALLQIGPDFAAALSPGHPAVVLDGAFDELQRTGDARPQTERAALEAFRRAPLSEVPLLIGARKALARGDEAAGDRLIAAASRRNPRSRYALLLQLDQQVRQGRAADAAATMALLTRSFPDTTQLLTAELARMAANPDTRDAVRRVMAGDPPLREAVLEQLARQGTDAATVLALAGPVRPTMAAAPAWQQVLVDAMVDRGQAAQALEVWLRLTGADRAHRAGGVYDRDFAGLPGPPPFNWILETSGDGFAERRGNALQAEFYGRGDARLASQLVVLNPGEYRLGFMVEGEAESESGGLFWTVACHPGDRVLAEIPITGVGRTAKRVSGAFTVPARGCPGQWLRLVGRAVEFPDDQQVTIRQLRIEGAGLR